MWSIYVKKQFFIKLWNAWEWVNEERFTHKYDRWRKQTVCERHFTMTCSGPRSRTRTSAVYLKMWRVSKHLRQSTYEWAGGVCVSCLRALQSWLMCIESSCVMHRHTHTHTLAYKHTHHAHAKSSNAADFFPPPYCGCCHGNKLRISGFEKLYLTWSVSVSGGGGGDNKRGVDRSRCGPPLPPPPHHQCVCTGLLRGADCSQNIDSYVNMCWPPGSTRVKGSQTQAPAPVDSLLQLYTFHRETLVCEKEKANMKSLQDLFPRQSSRFQMFLLRIRPR